MLLRGRGGQQPHGLVARARPAVQLQQADRAQEAALRRMASVVAAAAAARVLAPLLEPQHLERRLRAAHHVQPLAELQPRRLVRAARRVGADAAAEALDGDRHRILQPPTAARRCRGGVAGGRGEPPAQLHERVPVAPTAPQQRRRGGGPRSAGRPPPSGGQLGGVRQHRLPFGRAEAAQPPRERAARLSPRHAAAAPAALAARQQQRRHVEIEQRTAAQPHDGAVRLVVGRREAQRVSDRLEAHRVRDGAAVAVKERQLAEAHRQPLRRIGTQQPALLRRRHHLVADEQKQRRRQRRRRRRRFWRPSERGQPAQESRRAGGHDGSGCAV